MEMVLSSNFAHRACSNQVNMLCIFDKYRSCEFHLNALAGQKGEFWDSEQVLSHLKLKLNLEKTRTKNFIKPCGAKFANFRSQSGTQLKKNAL